MKKATIYDLWRMCKHFKRNCDNCPPIHKDYDLIYDGEAQDIDRLNELILKWCKEHPAKTRQDKFLEMFPNAHLYTDGILLIKPCLIDECVKCENSDDCYSCRCKYWLAEVEE